MKIFFWWQSGLDSLFPTISRFISSGMDRFAIVRFLRTANFDVHEDHIKEYIDVKNGTKCGYVQHVLIDHYKEKHWDAFSKLSELIKEPSYYRDDHNYKFSKSEAKKISKKIKKSILLEMHLAEKGFKENDLLMQNIKKSVGYFAAFITFLASVVTVLTYFDF